jgi:L-alanine-DL-glutamate epimerase-like enolase superfamily enzyme
MGDPDFMKLQIEQKIQAGFRVLKIKVGALEPEIELDLLSWIRSRFKSGKLEIRLDANGAWEPEDALSRMEQYAAYDIHSMEQPIAPGKWESLGYICENAPFPVALDEELIGLDVNREGAELLREVHPHFLILKPGLLGGFRNTERWVELAEERGAGWWVTSALESSVGLSAIAQWTYTQPISIPQGLGTGMIYRNNLHSPLQIEGDSLWYHPQRVWDLSLLNSTKD